MRPKSQIRNNKIKLIKHRSNTYKLDYDNDRIVGYVDGTKSVEQAIYKILQTSRYVHEIYSWNYGIELEDLFGKPRSFVYPELKRRITDALSVDDRILYLSDFEFSATKRDVVLVKFVANTIYGYININKEVGVILV